jgi:hypothetical protein
MNFSVLFGVALVPLFVGMVWYNPKVFGNSWMKANGFTEESIKTNPRPMWQIFLLLYIFSFLSTMVLMQLCIHQIGAYGMIGGEINATTLPSFQAFMTDYGNTFRTFKHGALHGGLASFIMSLFMVGTGAMFEMKSWKYIFIHVGYLTICGIIMGGLICQFMTFS